MYNQSKDQIIKMKMLLTMKKKMKVLMIMENKITFNLNRKMEIKLFYKRIVFKLFFLELFK
jgi:hypothetical protein